MPAGAPAPRPPALPDGILVQLAIPGTGERYRIGADGRFLVTLRRRREIQQPPRSKSAPGSQTLSSAALGRLAASLARAGFWELPPRIRPSDCVPAGTVLPGSGRAVQRQPIVIAARGPTGIHAVELSADPGVPCTFGALEGFYVALDEEALGGWMNE